MDPWFTQNPNYNSYPFGYSKIKWMSNVGGVWVGVCHIFFINQSVSMTDRFWRISMLNQCMRIRCAFIKTEIIYSVFIILKYKKSTNHPKKCLPTPLPFFSLEFFVVPFPLMCALLLCWFFITKASHRTICVE